MRAMTDFRRVFAAYPTGVAALAAIVDDVPVGMAANSFTSVSLDPLLASVSVAHSSSTWPVLRAASRIGVSVLGADQEGISRQLAARGVDRFAGLSWRATQDGAVLLDGAGAWFETSVEDQMRAGDHDIVVLRVHNLGIDPAISPLVFHGSAYHRLHVEGD